MRALKMMTLAFSLFLAAASIAPAFAGDVYVHGYYRSDGTYVRPHYRSAPDGNPYNNWSTRGNVNPYTGKLGTKSPYGSSNTYGTSPRSGSSGYGSGYGNSLLGGSNRSQSGLDLYGQ